jgi:hypothetical protein
VTPRATIHMRPGVGGRALTAASRALFNDEALLPGILDAVAGLLIELAPVLSLKQTKWA